MGSRHVLRARGEPARGGLFASLAEGLGRLAEGVAARLERTVLELATPVRRLSDLDADAAVLAVPAYAAADILADTAPEAAVALREIPYADSVSATLAFPADGFPTVAGHGVLFAAGEGGGVRGFTWVDRKWAGRAPEDYRLVRAFLEGDSEPVEWALAALERLLGRVPAPERTWIFSRSRAMPQYTLGHPARLRAVEAGLAKLPGVEVAGAAYRGVGVPDVIRDGREAAARAIAYLEGSSTQSRVRWSQKARPA